MANWNKILSRGSVEDRRTSPVGAMGGLGIGGIVIYLVISYLNSGTINVDDVLTGLQGVQVQEQTVDPSLYEGSDSYEVFASTVLGSTNDTWSGIFANVNKTYTPPKLVLFRGGTTSACGGAQSAVGPHYCPLDHNIYLDETFFDELQQNYGAGSADVAQAYVIAHEVGHHVQNTLGLLNQGDNQESIKTELQADCFAGLWANSIKNQDVLEFNEIQEAMDAAAAVGDDNIQQRATGYINPESWTHGSSEQRKEWFNRGYETGLVSACSGI